MIQLSEGKYLGQNKQCFSTKDVIVSETCYNSQVFEGWHYHENHHISFILQGGNIEERKNSKHSITAGSIVYYRSGELHRNYDTLHPSRNINLEIDTNFFKNYNLDVEGFPESLNSGESKFTLLRIFNDCRYAGIADECSIHFLLLQLFNKKEKIYIHSNWAKQLKEILHDDWNQELTLRSLSARLGVHPITISKNFSNYFNCNLGEYIRKLRVEKAIVLICTKKLSLTQIAHYCGFYDQSHFIRIFQSQIGVSPKVLKKL